MVRGKNCRVVKRVETSVMSSNVEKKRWKELNRLLDGMLVEHYAWGLVIDEPEPERPLYDRARERSANVRKPKNDLEKSKEARRTPKPGGVRVLALAGVLLGTFPGASYLKAFGEGRTFRRDPARR